MLSAGRHPVSRRARASHADRRAVGVAQRAGGSRVIGVHAGPFDSDVAYDFFAAGVNSIEVVAGAVEEDPLPLLVSWWGERRPAVALFGDRAEQGESTGMLPYFFAEALRLPIVSGVVSLAPSGDVFEALQAPSVTTRRQIIVRPPFVAVTSARSALPLRFSHSAARHRAAEPLSLTPAGEVRTWASPLVNSTLRPMSLRSDIGAPLDQRLSALIGGGKRSRQRYAGTAPDEAARLIADALKGLGFWKTG
jgi:electron transfer flavoprotein beta subunit